MTASRFASSGAALALAVLLVGCAETGPAADSGAASAEDSAAAVRRASPASPNAAESASASAAETSDPDAPAGDAGKDTAGSAAPPSDPSTAEAQEASRPALPFEAAGELVGRAGDDVAALLGPPSFRRRDGPAEVWQYHGRACLLDVFIYDGRTGRRVAYAEIRRRNGVHLSERECVADIVAAAEGKSG